jgi:hypothetical protein
VWIDPGPGGAERRLDLRRCRDRANHDDAMSDPIPDQPGRLEEAAFNLLLDSYPAPWAREEIIRALAADPNEFAARDAVNNGLRDLVGYGLLHQIGEFFLLTRSAIHSVRLCG